MHHLLYLSRYAPLFQTPVCCHLLCAKAKQVPNYQHEQQIKVMQPFSFVNYQPESRQVAPSFVCEQFSEQQ